MTKSHKLRTSINNILGRILSDRTYIKLRYLFSFHNFIDLRTPRTFNEKINWLKLYDRDSLYTICADKCAVREYVKNKIGSEYLINCLGTWTNFDMIDFNSLPYQFVLKCNHDAASVIICDNKDNLDYNKLKKHFNYCLRQNQYWGGKEWAYKNIAPLIMAEEKLQPKDGMLNDYKFFCFNGKVKFFKVDFDRFSNHWANYYTKDMELLPFGEVVCPRNATKKIKKPEQLDTMICLAEKLAEKFKFVRVDFYNFDEKIYFGEMTFYPSCGFGMFAPNEWDEIIGKYLYLEQ